MCQRLCWVSSLNPCKHIGSLWDGQQAGSSPHFTNGRVVILRGWQLGSCGSRSQSTFSHSFVGCLHLQLAKLTVWVFLKALYVLCFKCPCSVSVSLILQQGKIKYPSIYMISFCCSCSIWISYQWNKRGDCQGLSSKKALVNNDSWWFAIGLKKVLVAKSCPTLCDLMDYSPQGPSVHGILQARILEWVAIHDPRIKPMSPALQEDSLPSEAPGKPSHGSKQYYFSSKFWFK